MKFLRFLTLLSLSLFLAACGGGGGGGGSTGFGPTANAGASRSVAMGDTVTLNGSASTAGSSGGTLSYSWTLRSKPSGSAAGLSSATVVSPSFVADLPGKYEVQLVVRDSSLGSEAVVVTITATNTEPVAIAEPTQSVLIGSTVALDGSASVPPTGGNAGLLRYQWALTGAPAGSTATLSNATSAQAGFYTDVAGSYTATLIVTYESQVSNPLTVTVTAKASNSAPTAVAKISTVGGSSATPTNSSSPFRYTVERGQSITLNASESTDVDGDNLTYRWYFFFPSNVASLIPACSTMPRGTVLTGANPTFTPDAAGSWTVYMVAYDGTSVSSTTNLNITVTKPASAANTPPQARFVSVGESLERELGTYFYAFGVSCDIDGNTLTRSYEWVSTPPGFVQTDLTGVTGLAIQLTHPGDYSVRLTVNDGQGGTDSVVGTVTALVGANTRPVPAVTTDAATLMVGSTAWFDGSGSSDANGDQLSYAWTLIDRPDGSSATLQNPSSVRTGLMPDVAGAYIARLQVTDPQGATGLTTSVYHARILVKARNNEPTVASVQGSYVGSSIAFWTSDSYRQSNTLGSTLGTDEQPFVAGNPLIFVANSVVDPDNDTLYYLWTLAQPATSTLVDADAAQNLTRTPTVAGNYSATFVTSDGIVRSSPRSVAFKVVEEANYPTVMLKAHGSFADNSPAVPTQAIPVPLPYALTDQTYTGSSRFSLFAYGGSYTIVNLTATSATPGLDAPTFDGLVDGQVISQGGSVLFRLVPPAGLTTLQTRDLTWSFGIREKPGYTFTYRVLNR